MSAYSPPSLNAASDEESPAQLEQPLNPPTSHASVGTANWVVPAHDVSGSTVARATMVPTTNTATDLPMYQKRILFVWLCIATLFYAGWFIFCIFYGLLNIFYSHYLAGCTGLLFSVLVVWAVTSKWKAYGKREYRLVLFHSIVPAFTFFFSIIYG